MATAIATYSTAKGYGQSAFLMMNNPMRISINNDTTFMLSYHLLLGFSVELFLKAYLQQKGHDEKELRGHGVRHNLDKLLEMCEVKGMPSNVAKRLVEYLNEQHANFEYRYINEAAAYEIRWQADVFEELSVLNKFVDAEVGASASKGVQPTEALWTLPPQYNGWRVPREL